MKKGLIIPSGSGIDESGRRSTFGGNIDPGIVRFWVTFWDEFICPQNNFVAAGLSPDLQYLSNLGLLEQPKVSFSGEVSSGNLALPFIQAQEITYHRKAHDEPGKWSMASTEGCISSPVVKNHRPCLIFEIINGVQLPDKSVPIDDILNFKSKRSAECDAFHSSIEDIYQKIKSSSDIPRAKTHEIMKFEQSLSDLNSVLEQSFVKRRLSNTKLVLDKNLLNSAALGIGSASLAPQINMPMLDIGVFVACVSFSIGGLLSSRPTTPGPFTYVTSIRTKLY